ncbi:hypothetical protein [Bradyrhizobium sp. S69]|uniref:hypothetical protein n=1 Tax=Bradyrhizobium sp. S69 TaxID=1641856 RepID=UPI00131D3AED|nr:hypothetical protein [Bradyrhizobium sp. S69]
MTIDSHIACLRVRNGNPIVFGGPIDRKAELRWPPVGLTLIDESNQFCGCFSLSIDHLYEQTVTLFA